MLGIANRSTHAKDEIRLTQLLKNLQQNPFLRHVRKFFYRFSVICFWEGRSFHSLPLTDCPPCFPFFIFFRFVMRSAAFTFFGSWTQSLGFHICAHINKSTTAKTTPLCLDDGNTGCDIYESGGVCGITLHHSSDPRLAPALVGCSGATRQTWSHREGSAKREKKISSVSGSLSVSRNTST